MSRIYKISIPFVYREGEESSKICYQNFYFETDDCSPEKKKVIDYLDKLHKEEINDATTVFSYNGEWLDMIDIIKKCKEWPNVYEGMSMISIQIEIKGYGKNPLSVERIKPVKL